MIELLRVSGVGGITHAELNFKGAFIVITGESGSGKSSLVRAFEFLSGRRAQASLIRSGQDEAVVEAMWNRVADDSGSLLVTKRSLSRSGKGRCMIHGALATAGQLSEASAQMIEIQSQFSQLNLLDPARQLDMVDHCGGDSLLEALGALASVFPVMLETEREIIDLKKRRSELERELEGAPARVRGIKFLSLYPGCEKEWTAELSSLEKRLADAARYDGILNRLNGGDSDRDPLEQVTSLIRSLYAVAPPEERSRWTGLGESALRSLQELFDAARRELAAVSAETLETSRDQVETKIGMLRRMKRETGRGSEEDLLAYIGEVESGMSWQRECRDIMDAKRSRAASLRAEVSALAKELRSLRELAASDFEDRVNLHLKDLAMEDSKFSIVINRLDKVRANGAESASFLLAQSNLPPNPVGKAASGGELSRILIAMQASIDPSRLPGVIVFDEVEAGLGGRTALLAGRKLKELSKSCKTILITHEATIAAMADQHFMVSREGDETSVSEVTGEKREREIARMLSGAETSEALEHARALLGMSQPE
ncbi:MAG: AAA family ATPase [Synergistaceae bacterium]|jgi:DNA repair protein RecN (Recombination protein N)|nr:AAA family ATPase [Synergistaceae bacterium]